MLLMKLAKISYLQRKKEVIYSDLKDAKIPRGAKLTERE